MTTTHARAQQQGVAEVNAVYERYLSAFLAGDLAAVEALVQFPLAYIGAGETRLLDRFPVSPQALRERKQWHTTINADYEVSLVAPDKAHVILHHAERVRADGSLIETVAAFYAFTRTANGWKLFALSDVVIPA
ncbi:MAG: hypothetical protein AB7I68_04835 [Porticoccaceae bacterium]